MNFRLDFFHYQNSAALKFNSVVSHLASRYAETNKVLKDDTWLDNFLLIRLINFPFNQM